MKRLALPWVRKIVKICTSENKPYPDMIMEIIAYCVSQEQELYRKFKRK